MVVALPQTLVYLLRDQLDQRQIKVGSLHVDLWSGKIVLNQLSRESGRIRFNAESAQLRLSKHFLWSDGFSGADIDLFNTNVILSTSRSLKSLSSKPEASTVKPQSLHTILKGSRIHWNALSITLQSPKGGCEVSLASATLGPDEPPIPAELDCNIGEYSIQTHATFQLQADGNEWLVRPTMPVALSGLPLSIDYQSLILNFERVPNVTLKNVAVEMPQAMLSLKSVNVADIKEPLVIAAVGGQIDLTPAKKNMAAAANEQFVSTVSKFPKALTLPDFRFDWFGAKISFKQQELVALQSLAVRPEGLNCELARGDSSISMSASVVDHHWLNATFQISGLIHLADVDGIWPNDAMIDGVVGVDGDFDLSVGQGRFSFTAPAIRLLHPSLAMMPFHLPSLSSSIQMVHGPNARETVLNGSLDVEDFSTKFQLGVWDFGNRFQFEWSSPTTDCSRLEKFVPKEWNREMTLALDGQATPRLTMSGQFDAPESLSFRFRGVFGHCRVEKVKVPWSSSGILVATGDGVRRKLSDAADVDPLNQAFVKRVHASYTKGALIEVGPASSEYWLLGQLPAHVGGVMYLSEEVGFYKNLAVDLGLIQRAIRLDLTHGRYVYGGSTITQQLVKNLFLDRRKTLRRKFHEMLLADRIYRRISKDRTLELYLNVIEFGPRIFGIGQAARYYFQKEASALTINEAIFLAMLKPSPSLGSVYVGKGRTPNYAYWFERADQLLGRLVEHQFVTPEDAAKLPPLAFRWADGVVLDSFPKKATNLKTGLE